MLITEVSPTCMALFFSDGTGWSSENDQSCSCLFFLTNSVIFFCGLNSQSSHSLSVLPFIPLLAPVTMMGNLGLPTPSNTFPSRHTCAQSKQSMPLLRPRPDMPCQIVFVWHLEDLWGIFSYLSAWYQPAWFQSTQFVCVPNNLPAFHFQLWDSAHLQINLVAFCSWLWTCPVLRPSRPLWSLGSPPYPPYLV